MSLAIWFWIFFSLSILARGSKMLSSDQSKVPSWTGDLTSMLLFGILGWAVFGSIVG